MLAAMARISLGDVFDRQQNHLNLVRSGDTSALMLLG
jgi:hypothetical protein